MPVLIDGDNLLHAARAAKPPGPLVGRSILCDTIGRWARRRAERVRVIFDGPEPNPSLAKQIGNADIDVSYSGGQSADAVLIGILETDSAARRLLVVSSDHEIAHAAKRRRARPIRSDEFWALVQHDLARPPPGPSEPREKRHGQTPEATDKWLREFGLEDSQQTTAEG
ncbi:MAG: NYN domain-containing protein [Phycisphaerae bacterium]|nr:NYN domain-containing protein [Phycisphaerae bacterium]HOO17057.1 NYN domain-containing protein [Phycisphaerae bacterium]HPC23073.1 NYN domain-containing protein [Phycisphaerae bacterium]HRS28869.1 NYN domain-containing protein [Phycisphaerae bacterium]HRT42117.1 NYN domain-containing protein [Phycisphaerae bacterium]